ncbi:hypothetical protein N7E70_003955 [Aminobacter sp. NyZ550]|uniref:Uncharacterized protein n=1 Tax=Aminobacter aminovorans TaxID=83263 RepID=A0ABR6H9F7_AMIAI|nr:MULTISPECIES: hypothetical protein [Aminobacter]MBB3707066.1 hypothetical protein [Aminobacter aminovorans]WAX96042.1 hypothetical protein N7E70_003955 [Aminobacter sp. NyZ550]WMC96929.1 hypothetical protein RAR13_26885 [Aminobacter aminovorans]
MVAAAKAGQMAEARSEALAMREDLEWRRFGGKELGDTVSVECGYLLGHGISSGNLAAA